MRRLIQSYYYCLRSSQAGKTLALFPPPPPSPSALNDDDVDGSRLGIKWKVAWLKWNAQENS